MITHFKLSFLYFSNVYFFSHLILKCGILILHRNKVFFFFFKISNLITVLQVLGTPLPTLICQYQKGCPELLLAPSLLPPPLLLALSST